MAIRKAEAKLAVESAEPGPKDIEIVRVEGDRIILPTGMTIDDGIKWLMRKKENEEKVVALDEVIDVFPLEGAYAFFQVLKAKFGFTTLSDTPGMFSSQPPLMIAVDVDVDRTEQVPWGRIQVPGMDGWLSPSATVREGNLVFSIVGETKRKHLELVHELGQLTREWIRTQSIYRGRAIRVTFPDSENDFNIRDCPKFMDVSGVRPEELIFPEETRRMVATSILTPIRHADACRAAGIPRKRGILMEGPYGVGKTLTANVTAKTCVDHKWTFIYLNRVSDLSHAIQFARQYQPAVIFAEDIDRIMRDDGTDERDDSMDEILNTLDGIDTKSLEVMVVLTTNHVKRINKALLRPGRLDAVIRITAPDAVSVQRLVRLYARGLVAEDENIVAVGEKLAGQIPAVIREVVERAKLAAIEERGQCDAIVASDLTLAADSMLRHLELLSEDVPVVKDVLADITEALAKRTAERLKIDGFAEAVATHVSENN